MPQLHFLPFTCYFPTPTLDMSPGSESASVALISCLCVSSFPQLALCSWPLVLPSPFLPLSGSFPRAVSFMNHFPLVPQQEGPRSSLLSMALATVFL